MTRMVLLNARSVNNKLPELHYMLYSMSYDVILISESWLYAGAPDSLLDPEKRFTVVRCDRLTLGGGVCALISKQHNVIVVDIAESYSDLEICCFDLLYNDSASRCRIFIVYRPPNTNNMSRIAECLCKFSDTKFHCIIAGDFNCKKIDWQSLVAPADGKSDVLLDFTITQGFTQLVDAPTRNHNLLDILLSSEPLAICNLKVIEPFSRSDHCQVEFSMFSDNADDVAEPDLNVKRYDWSNADYDEMSNYIAAINWNDVLAVNLTADSLWAALSDILQSAIDMFVPVKHVSEYTRTKNRRWYPAALRRAITRKKCLWRKHRESPDDETALSNYRKAEQKCRQLLRDYEIKREEKVIDSNNAGGFFRFVNGKLSCRRGLGALCSDKGDVITGDVERANLLNQYFASVCTSDDGITPPFPRAVPSDVQLETVNFTPNNVFAVMRNLKPGGSCGPDGFPPQLFKKLAGSLAEPLSLMYSSFMSVGQMPRAWAHAIVTPIYKSGSASSVSNYRPISLTCVAGKIMERVVVSSMLSYLRLNHVITKQQHGFLQGRSTSTNLLETINDWTLSINDRKSVAVAYIDFAKAFDTVCRSKLLSKLAAYGVSGQLLHWIESFLSGRSQQTRVGHSLSDVTSLSSGIVQGSVLGPILFVLFINDIVRLFSDEHCTCKLYADDLKLFTEFQTDADCDVLQRKLNDIYEWSNKWQLTISYKKCNVMYVGKHARPTTIMHINGNCLAVMDEVRDLGVIIDPDLSFHSHINKMVARAFIRSKLIHKCFVSRHVPVLMRAFTVYVRPLVEYATCVWSPHQAGLIKKVESVQRKFTKWLPGFWNLDYKTRLERLKLDSLELRRLRQDLIFTYKVVFGLTGGTCSDFFAHNVNTHDTRGHEHKLYADFSRLDVHKYFFTQRVIIPWNELPAESKHFASVHNFKHFINNINLSKYTSLQF